MWRKRVFFAGPHGDRALMVHDLALHGIEWASLDREGRAMWTAAWERLRVPVLSREGVRFGE